MLDLTEKIESRFEKVKEDNRKLVETVTRLQSENTARKPQLQGMSDTLRGMNSQSIANEQYSPKHNIRVFGPKEEKEENSVQKVIKAIDIHMGIMKADIQIEVAHRITSHSSPSPMILLLEQHTTKMMVMKAEEEA